MLCYLKNITFLALNTQFCVIFTAVNSKNICFQLKAILHCMITKKLNKSKYYFPDNLCKHSPFMKTKHSRHSPLLWKQLISCSSKHSSTGRNYPWQETIKSTLLCDLKMQPKFSCMCIHTKCIPSWISVTSVMNRT